jgi:small subunit ribosomal protein S21|tara:strand:+ start:412 stop:591 length:180 start_codon:yes stop_codon:yes gene_type:complete
MSNIQVKVKRGERIDRAMRRLKKKMDREGILKEVHDRRYFKKPSEIKKEKINSRRGRKR